MIGKDLLGKGFIASQHQSAGIAASVPYPQQLEVGDDVLIKDRDTIELLKEIEADVGLPFVDRLANHCEVTQHADRLYFVPHLAEGGDDVKFCFPLCGREVDTGGILRRDQPLMHHGQHAQLFHSATR